MLIVIDNYDSFTYNLVQYLGELGEPPKVYRNDEITVESIKKMKPEHIVISPGPGRPENAGITKDLILACHKIIPILGVCLGHQSIGEVFGGKTVHAPYLMHGKTSKIFHDGKSIYKKIKSPFTATRYHSLIADRDTLPACLEITAWTEDNIIMGIRHKKYPVEGVQFHPESILTEYGRGLLKNFINQ